MAGRIPAMQILQRLQTLDNRLFEHVFRHSGRRTVILLAKSITHSGGGLLHFAVPLLLWSLGVPESGRFMLTLLLALALERLLYRLLKNGLKRRRPQDYLPGFNSLITAPDKFSFPSGHSSAAFLLATVLTVFYGGIFAGMFIWAAAVALSRILLGVHFPGDTLAGAIMGICVGLAIAPVLT
jgi:undecaprenyl-diphosphatase